MPHVITYTEEIEEHGLCQQCPALRVGDKYLHEVDGKKRLRIVLSVRFDKYVYEKVAQWSTVILEYLEEEYTLRTFSIFVDKSTKEEIPVFVAGDLIGILTCDKDLIRGTLVVTDILGSVEIRGVAPFGFYDCQHLKKVSFGHFAKIAYEYAFANSGVSELAGGWGMPVMLHNTAIEGCKNMPSIDTLNDSMLDGYGFILRSGKAFSEREDELYRQHFLNQKLES